MNGSGVNLSPTPAETVLLLPKITSPGITRTIVGLEFPTKSAVIDTFHEYAFDILTDLPLGLHCQALVVAPVPKCRPCCSAVLFHRAIQPLFDVVL